MNSASILPLLDIQVKMPYIFTYALQDDAVFWMFIMAVLPFGRQVEGFFRGEKLRITTS